MALQYYTYILAYVDDLLCLDVDPKSILQRVAEGGYVKYKKGKIEEPENYLGARLKKRELDGKAV